MSAIRIMSATRIRRICGLRVILAACLATWAVCVPAAVRAQSGALEAQTAAFADDAELTDVFFLQPELGWAVGDRGTVWQTTDGGASWKLQASGVRGRLEGVFFLDPARGWIVGGETDPYTRTTRAILLTTDDGGRRWTRDDRSGLPAIRRLRFFDDKYGWALCRPSTVFPTGLFSTNNGGKSWRPVHGPADRPWLDADLFNPNDGAAVGPAGAIVLLRRQALEPTSSLPPVGLRNLRGLRFAADGRSGWLVGDGGLLLRTDDYGKSWQTPVGEPPEELRELFDWQAVAAVGEHAWIVGSPGSRILHTPDGGKSWKLQPTGGVAPLRKVHFVDERCGWAVGSLGTILATTDGGKSWRTQRSGGTRAGVLLWTGRPDDVPLELVARLGGQDGYLTVADVWSRSDTAPNADRRNFLEPWLQQAVVQAGGTAAGQAWQFPLPWSGADSSPEETFRLWNKIHESRALHVLNRELVRRLRTWRPEVLIIPPPGEGTGCPLDHLLNQAMLQAAEQAPLASVFPEQLTLGGLAPWTVKRVFASLGPNRGGEINFEPHQLSLRLGQSFADLAAEPRGMLQTDPGPSAPMWGFQRMSSRSTHDAGSDFFAGLVLQPGGDARRKQPPLPPANAAAWRQLSERKRNLDAIITRARSSVSQGPALLGQAGEMVRDLDEPRAGLVLFHMATQFEHSGRRDLAAETLDLLLDRFPQHSLAGKSAERLVQFWASGETAWQERKKQRHDVQRGVLNRPEGLANLPPLQSANTNRIAIDDSQELDRPAKAAAAAARLERFHTAVYYEPRVRFPLAAADIRRGLPQQAEKFMFSFRQGRTPDAWTACIDGERWLTSKRTEMAPKELWYCDRAAARPKLDGSLDEPFWKSARPACFRNPDGSEPELPGAVLTAYDGDFLYFGIMCRKAAGEFPPQAAGPRPRDADLARQDRVSIHLDIDRDWVTAYRFEVDRRGWVREELWGEPGWNPTWFVAAGETADRWTAEIAIPFAELTEHHPSNAQTWAIGVFRELPAGGVQSWTVPFEGVGMQPGCGYLMFR